MQTNTINQFIPNQLPQLYKSNGPLFVSFIKAYYEYLEQSNNPIYFTRNFSNLVDIDNTLDEFLSHFKNEYMNSLPSNIMVNPRLLMKHIIDLYSSKGSKKGIELLFRILFNESIQLYLPSQHLFKTSDNTWVQLNYIEVTDSPYLNQLIGCTITNGDNSSRALVEDYTVIRVNNKVINVLIISNLNGNFLKGNIILSPDISALTSNIAPTCLGSLSSISLYEGGIEFNIGDIVNVTGITGSGALARIASVTSSGGKTLFKLINGGYGFTLNADVQVTNGGGTGATFNIGGLSNESIYVINTDVIDDYLGTQLDIESEGFTLNISNTIGTFQVGEVVNSTANALILDFSYITGGLLNDDDILSNSSLGIAGLEVVTQDVNIVTVTGADTYLNNANIVGGIELIGSVSDDVIYINSVIPKITYKASAIVETVNSTIMTINCENVVSNYDDNYFLISANLIGNTSGAYATIQGITRDSNWIFPVPVESNLDSVIENVLDYETLIIGTIDYLTNEDPGNNYISNATVTITEPLIEELQISDGSGGYWGSDANVTATAVNAGGIATSVQVIESGYGFSPNEPVNLISNNQYVAKGYAVVDSVGINQGYWNSNKSFLSDEIYLQDSYYYQTFSYEILAPRMLQTYETFMQELMHPIGYALFGRYWNIDQLCVNSSVNYTSTIQINADDDIIIQES